MNNINILRRNTNCKRGGIYMGQSWSGIRKELEENFLCDSLKGRVKYFYHNAPNAIYEYKNSNIIDSINSENMLVRMLAVMDRRVGKRTLFKLTNKIYDQLDWLKFFYKLRLDAEGMK